VHAPNRLIIIGAVLPALLVVCAATAAGVDSSVKITNCNTASSHPKLLTLTCGDGNTVLKGLAWSSFGSSSAKATGRLVMNTCDPDCAQGKDVSYSVAVQASDPRTCKQGLRVYDKLTLRFTGRPPAARSSLTRWTLGCPI